ncbi:MAG TPA: HEAT repeat domain-containing protein, partial [Anaerolineales bacterium]|nr:HEAT repeat domain-containing protein [Anaerolineales bacterium]
MAGLVATLFLCVQAGQGIGENAAFALFLSSIDVDFLPFMYMGLGGVVFIASMAFSAGLSRFQNSSVVINLLAGAAILFGVEWVAIVLFKQSFSYPLLWLTTYGMAVVLGTLLWTAAGEVCDARQAKRLFPLFTSMGILGSVLGNLLTGTIASHVGTEGLILFYAILLASAFLLTRKIASAYFKPEADTDIPFSLVNDVRAGYDFVRNSQLFRMIAISSILYSILFFTVDFPFSERISIEFADDPARLAGFKGLFTSITTAVTFLVSLLLANRLYTRLGIVNSVLIMPLTYVAAFTVFFISFNFWGAVGAKFGQLVILGGLTGTAWNALFNVVPAERRGQVLAFNNGVPAQIGVVLSGVLIILSRRSLDTQNILLLGAFLALVTVAITIRMRSAYGDALLSALRAGRTEVFTDEDESFIGYKEDPGALQVILKTLQDPRPDTRRLAAQMLARMGNMMAVPDLVERLADEDASVRAAATRALADLGARAVFHKIIFGLDDPDDFVREETLSALPKLGVDSSPKLIRILERMAKGRENIKVKAHAAVVLTYLGKGSSVRAMLYRLLRNKNVNKRLIGLDALEHIAEYADGKIPFRHTTVLVGLKDPYPIVRRETVRVFSLLKDVKNYDAILGALADEDVGVRRNASELLNQIWPASRDGLVQILEKMNRRSLDAALDAIPPGAPEILDVLREYVQREVSNIWYLRTLVNSFTEGGQLVALLSATLLHRESLSEERLIKAVGLFGNRRALDIVRK